ncbi:MAG: hypothetical protein R3B96_03765 [Pirellulaceae bacterium]
MVNYYPWGDARIRPFLRSVSVWPSIAVDTNSLSIQESTLSIPFGGGVKFRCLAQRLARSGLIDNLSLGSGVVSTMNNLSHRWHRTEVWRTERYYPCRGVTTSLVSLSSREHLFVNDLFTNNLAFDVDGFAG